MVLYYCYKMKLSSIVLTGHLSKNFSVFVRTSSPLFKSRISNQNCHQKNHYSNQLSEAEEFRVLELVKKRRPKVIRKNPNLIYFKEPREKHQSVTQDWGNVWPGIRTFHPASVPLPVRMGFPLKRKPPPDKWANAELMKIPNFLHLTPPVIKRQCEAIKGFCTPWPKELETEEAQNYHYPVTLTTSTYLHSSPTLRDPLARIASIQLSVDSLDLNYDAEDKFLRLVGDRFDPKTRIVTLMADRCPLSSQNTEYCFYLLTVLYNESLKKEAWEHEKEADDFESYNYSVTRSKTALQRIEEKTGEPIPEPVVDEYLETVTKLHNEGEDEEVLRRLRNASLKLLNLA